MDIASGKYVIRHVHISTYEFPLEYGVAKGPIRSEAIESNSLLVGFM